MRDYTDAAFAGDFVRARMLRDSLEPVRDALKRTRPGGKPQAAQKYWQELLGQTGGAVRRPMLALTEPERAAIRAAFAGCGLGQKQAAE
jgi:4-hydroxy-tetrahydrodipicolinate synthase